MRSVGKAQGHVLTTCMTAGGPRMSWHVLYQEPMPPAAWASCPWCQHRGIKHLISRRSPPSFLLVLNHPRVHVTTDESRSTQVTQMLSLLASAPGDSTGGEGGVRWKQCTRGRWGCPEPPETTAGWQGAPPPTSCPARSSPRATLAPGDAVRGSWVGMADSQPPSPGPWVNIPTAWGFHSSTKL